VGFTSGDPELAERVRSELPEGFEFRTSDKAGNAAKAYRIVMTVRSRVGVAKPGYINQVPSGKWMVRKRTPTSPGTYVGLYPTREEAEAALETVAGTVTRRYQPNAVQAAIEDLGLTNARSATKFVPDLYKYNSVDVRWEVLRGLMDTDGYTEPHPRNQVSYTSISQRMAGDVEWLVASLGGTSRTTTKQPKGGQLAYTVWISLNDRSQAFHLARKRDNCRPRVRQVVRRIVDAQPLGTGPARCITVANSDGLYVTDHFVVTHNSRALLERLLIVALKYPGMRGLIVRKTLSSLGSTALVTWREHVAKEAIAAGVVQFYGGSPAEAPQYRFNNGSVISVGGIDRPSRIMSMELDVCYVQEAVELDQADFEAITTRLRNGVMPYQQILADTNPDTPTHWLKVRADLGTTKLIESRHGDNPLLVNPDGTRTLIGEAYISKLDALTGVRKQRLRHGLWVATEGMVYEEYDPAVHLVDRFYIPRDWVRYWTVDFGFTNPFCWQNWAISPDGIAYLDAEIYMTRRTVDQHAKAILRAVTTRKGEWTQGRPRAIICDHDAEGRAVLERELGMSTSPARKAVLDGIQAVQMRLRDRGDGKRGLYLMRDAVVERDPELVDAKKPTCTADELPGYIWDTGAGKSTKEQPWKHDDHGADALRYLCTGLDEGRPRVRMMSYR
jgi:phage terminase large subunit